jgi:hypothetical protein
VIMIPLFLEGHWRKWHRRPARRRPSPDRVGSSVKDRIGA